MTVARPLPDRCPMGCQPKPTTVSLPYGETVGFDRCPAERETVGLDPHPACDPWRTA